MNEAHAQRLLATLKALLGDALVAETYAYGELTICVTPASISRAAVLLRDSPGLEFTQLSDLSGVDYSAYGEADWVTHRATNSGFSRAVRQGAESVAMGPKAGRFAVTYQLLSITTNQRLRLQVFLNDEPPRVASLVEVWPCADWYEREAFDLFGILFEGHPDLRRLLTDYGFIGHPFRKDFPLEGYVEVRYDTAKKRVVYQPVSIEPRTLVPRVIRDDQRGPTH